MATCLQGGGIRRYTDGHSGLGNLQGLDSRGQVIRRARGSGFALLDGAPSAPPPIEGRENPSLRALQTRFCGVLLA